MSDFYRVFPGYEAANDNAMFICRKLVSDMIYESRVSQNVTPDFPKETKCKPICMPGSSFMHIVT
jgi:hypothetical protein